MSPQEKVFEYMLFDLTNNLAPALTLTIDDGHEFARYGQTRDYTVSLTNKSPEQ